MRRAGRDAERRAGEWRWIGFGFVLTFSSSVGQTFFIGLFGADIRADFGLSHGAFGGLYTGATLAAGLAMLWLGRIVDHGPLTLPTLGVFVALAMATLGMGLAQGVAALVVALFGLRLMGQGLVGHVALTTMGRRPADRRGRVTALGALGFPAGEAILPPLVALALLTLDWRTLWMGTGALLLVVMAPLALALVRGHEPTVRETEAHDRDDSARALGQGMRRTQMLRDRRFYALLPGVLAPPFMLTAVFFHQPAVAAAKDWPLLALASAYPAYAASAIAASLLAGRIADRYGAAVLTAAYLWPLAVGLLLLAALSSTWIVAPALALFGATAGAATVLQTTLWAQLYGTRHLGEIRATVVALVVSATAASPGIVGALLDAEVAVTTQLAVMGLYTGLVALWFLLLRTRLHSSRKREIRDAVIPHQSPGESS